jgi:hypothetical protein
VVPLDFPALDTLRVDSLRAASALAVAVVFSFVFNDPLPSLCSTSFSLPLFPLLLPYRLLDLKNVPTLLCLFLFHFLPLFLSLLHFPGADDALMDALLHRSPLSPFLLACNKKMSRRVITFSDPPPQLSLKSICTFHVRMIRLWMLYCTDPLFPLSFWPATKKKSSRAITFSDPAPQRSLKSILIFSGVYMKKSQTESLFFQILHLTGV